MKFDIYNRLNRIDIKNDREERRVVVYARVSTEHDAQLYALENQKFDYENVLKAHPTWKYIRMYTDKGITGTSVEKRPQFLQMIEDAELGEFDLIITREVSRFARNTIDTLVYTDKLLDLGVAVYFVSDELTTLDEDGYFRLTMMASLAQEESRKLSTRVKRGQQVSMEKGVYYGNGNTLGYDRVARNQFVINPEQAKTVRMIYDWYLNGDGLRAIQFKLEQAGRLTAMGNTNWHMSNISKILKNSFYCGILTYHKQWTPNFKVQKKINNIGDMDYTIVEGSHEKIITKEEFDAVQKIMESRHRDMPESGAGRKRILGDRQPIDVWTELLECECGHRFNRKVWHRTENEIQYAYQCYSSIRTGTVKTRQNKGLSTEGICLSPMIPGWKLQMMAKHIFREYLMDISKAIVLAESILSKHIEDEDAKAKENEKIINRLEKEREKLEKRLSGLFDMRADGEITREEFLKKKADAEKKISEIEEEIDVLMPEDNEPEDEVDHEERMKILRFALDQITTPDDEKDIPQDVIRAFVKKIVVHPDSFDWYLRFTPSDGNDGPKKLSVEGKRKSSAKISSLGSLPLRLLLTINKQRQRDGSVTAA